MAMGEPAAKHSLLHIKFPRRQLHQAALYGGLRFRIEQVLPSHQRHQRQGVQALIPATASKMPMVGIGPNCFSSAPIAGPAAWANSSASTSLPINLPGGEKACQWIVGDVLMRAV